MIRDINSDDRYLLHLLACSLDGRIPQEKPDAVSWGSVLAQAQRHSVANTAFYAVERLADRPGPEVWRRWKEMRDKAVARDVVFSAELKRICSVLSEDGIRCMPVKGSRIRDLYPRTDMRSMADLDILIDEENAGRVKELMTAEGFVCEHFGSYHHDVYKKYPIVNVEIHRSLIPERLEREHAFYKDGFSHGRPLPNNGYVYDMPEEELYVYHVAHLHKHYAGSGSGIRSFMDIHVIRREFSGTWDEDMIAEMLDKLGLTQFERDMREVSEYWFNNGETSVKCLENEAFILGSGTYGTMENMIRKSISQIAGRGGKVTPSVRFRYYCNRLFPGRGYLYPTYRLAEYKALLPLVWTYRLVRATARRGRNIVWEVKTVKKLKEI